MQWKIGGEFFDNYDRVLNKKGGFTKEITASGIFYNSFIMAFGIASLICFYFDDGCLLSCIFKNKIFNIVFFWLIFITLLVPLELRILPSYQIVSDLNLTKLICRINIAFICISNCNIFFRQYFTDLFQMNY